MILKRDGKTISFYNLLRINENKKIFIKKHMKCVITYIFLILYKRFDFELYTIKMLNEKKFIKKEVLAYGELNMGFISIFKNSHRIFEIALA